MLVLASFLCLQSFSQAPVPFREPDYKKPKLFADLPAKMNLKTSRLEAFFTQPAGATVNTFITDEFLFQGKIVSKANESTHQSVVIRSTNRPGATLTFTKTVNADGTFRYIGRILSFGNGDAFEVTIENGLYYLQKTNLYDVINE